MKKSKPIKGLLQYLDYTVGGQMAIYIGIALVSGIIATVSGNTPMAPLLIMPLIASGALGLTTTADKTKWNRFQLTLPLKRKDIIVAKYLFFFRSILIGLLLSGIFIILARILDEMGIIEYGKHLNGLIELMGEINPRAIAPRTMLISIGLVLLACSVHFPLAYTLFKGKEEDLALLTLIVTSIIGALIVFIGVRIGLSLDSLTGITVVVPLILFVAAYMFTTKIYDKMDV